MSAPNPQRTWGHFLDGHLKAISLVEPTNGPNARYYDTPAIVVPEAAVKGCRHAEAWSLGGHDGAWLEVCRSCGSFRNVYRGHWKRPKILRVGRVSK